MPLGSVLRSSKLHDQPSTRRAPRRHWIPNSRRACGGTEEQFFIRLEIRRDFLVRSNVFGVRKHQKGTASSMRHHYTCPYWTRQRERRGISKLRTEMFVFGMTPRSACERQDTRPHHNCCKPGPNVELWCQIRFDNFRLGNGLAARGDASTGTRQRVGAAIAFVMPTVRTSVPVQRFDHFPIVLAAAPHV